MRRVDVVVSRMGAYRSPGIVRASHRSLSSSASSCAEGARADVPSTRVSVEVFMTVILAAIRGRPALGFVPMRLEGPNVQDGHRFGRSAGRRRDLPAPEAVLVAILAQRVS